MDMIGTYFALQKEIHEYFGYKEDWRVIPMEDAREYYWSLEQDSSGGGEVHFAESPEQLGTGEAHSNEIYTQRHLPKWVYRNNDYTMVCVDTHTDGNKFLQIFDNKKEIK